MEIHQAASDTEERGRSMLQEILEKFRMMVRRDKPYIASKGRGRWTIRHYDPLLRRWIDTGQTFFNKRDAELRLKEWLRNRAS
jgi:hypothetical protein